MLGDPLALSVALVVVLVSLGGLVVVSNLRVASALREQSAALETDSLFTDARLAVAEETLAVRAYRAEPSGANQKLLRTAVADVTASLFTTLQASDLAGTVDEVRLSSAQSQVQVTTEQMLRLQVSGDTSAGTVADTQVLPGCAALQNLLGQVADQFHARSQRQLELLRQVHHRALLEQASGGAAGALVVTGVLRLLWVARRREQRHAERNEHAARHDALTGLPNRASFQYVLDGIVSEPASTRRPAAVAVIDLDEFKAINDSFGHQAGDAVLVAVAGVLRGCVGDDDLVARLGGDEFIIVLRDREDPSDLQDWVLQTTHALRCDVDIDQGTVAVSGSVGVSALSAQDDAQTILHRADLAMYYSKTSTGPGASSRDTEGAADPSDSAERSLPADLPDQLRALVDDGDPGRQLEFHYQPLVAVVAGQVCGVEALIRWRHPSHGLLAPAHFLTLGFTPSLRIAFARLLLLRAVEEIPLVLTALATSRAVTPDPFIAVNVSADALASGVAHDLTDLLRSAGVAVGRVRVEVSQRESCRDVDGLAAAIANLRADGVRSTLGEFTLGRTDLEAVRRLRVDEVKIDRLAVLGGRGKVLDHRLLSGVAALAAALDLRLAAQGAHNEQTLRQFVLAGVDVVQGHHLSPPVPVSDLVGSLDQMQRRGVLTLDNPDRTHSELATTSRHR